MLVMSCLIQPSTTLLALPCFISHRLPLVSLARSFGPTGESLIQGACKLAPGQTMLPCPLLPSVPGDRFLHGPFPVQAEQVAGFKPVSCTEGPSFPFYPKTDVDVGGQERLREEREAAVGSAPS